MTNEEKMSAIQSALKSINDDGYIDIANHGCPDERNELEVIKEALEKQVPKKPIEDWSESPFSDDKGCLFLHTMCPNCKKVEVNKMDSFCYHCGQSLLWEDTE